MSILLGFAGQIGSGKSTACERLHAVAPVQTAEHIEFSGSVIRLADGWMGRVGEIEVAGPAELEVLRETTNELFGTDLSPETMARMAAPDLQPYLDARQAMKATQRPVSVETKNAHRPLLQWLAHQYVTNVTPNFWNNTIRDTIAARQAEGVELITVGGVRYNANAELIRGRDGHVVEVIRPSYSDDAQGHISEAGISPEWVDATVHNDGTIQDLGASMLRLWQDAAAGDLQPHYDRLDPIRAATASDCI